MLLPQLRNVFGAQRHAPRSLFIRVSKAHNGGRELDFIKPSECRMAGEFLQLLRVFRLKNAIVQCVSDKVFLDMPQEFQFLGPLVKNDKYWDLHFAVCQLLYPLMRLLRLADMRVGGMDKVKYYAMQVDRLMSNGLDNAVQKWKDAPKVELAMAANRKLPKPSEQEVINGKYILLFARINQQSNSSILCPFLLDYSDEEEEAD